MVDEDLTGLDDKFYTLTTSSPNLREDFKGLSNLELLYVQKRQLQELIVLVQNKPRPTYDVDGQNVEWRQYLDTLYKRLETIDDLISMEEGPTEEVTRAWN